MIGHKSTELNLEEFIDAINKSRDSFYNGVCFTEDIVEITTGTNYYNRRVFEQYELSDLDEIIEDHIVFICDYHETYKGVNFMYRDMIVKYLKFPINNRIIRYDNFTIICEDLYDWKYVD